MLVILLQLGGIGFVHYNMPLEQQVEAVKSIKQQPAGYEATPIVLSPKQELKQIQDIQACVYDSTYRPPCTSADVNTEPAALLCLYLALPCMSALHVCIAHLHCMFAEYGMFSLMQSLYTCSSQAC